jgi:hypothetical protein
MLNLAEMAVFRALVFPRRAGLSLLGTRPARHELWRILAGCGQVLTSRIQAALLPRDLIGSWTTPHVIPARS